MDTKFRLFIYEIVHLFLVKGGYLDGISKHENPMNCYIVKTFLVFFHEPPVIVGLHLKRETGYDRHLLQELQRD